MPVKKKLTWLLLLLRLPATHKAERVAIWRKVKKSGAIQIQTSTYILPDEPARYELFQWLTQEIRSAGGDATLVRAREIEGLPNEKLIELFNTARAKEYATVRESKRGARRQLATTSTASENSFARFGKPTSSTARGPRMWKCFCGKWKGRNQAKRQFQRLRREITAAEPGLRGRGRKSIASGPAGSSENSSIPGRSLSLRKGSRRMVAPFRSTCLTLNSRITEKTVHLKRC